MQDSHVTRIRALKDENARLREELARACKERDMRVTRNGCQPTEPC